MSEEEKLDITEDKQEPAMQVKQGKKIHPALAVLIEYGGILIVAYLIALFLTNFIIINCRVPSGSMLNTIQLNDRVIGSRLSYLVGEPKRGDIVIFNAPESELGANEKSKLFIKRLVGLPGETIEVKDNLIYINNSETPLDEPYLDAENTLGGIVKDFGPYVIPEGEYFFMGDHRNGSSDSRVWGSIPKSEIVAKAQFTYWPLSDLKWLNKSYDYSVD